MSMTSTHCVLKNTHLHIFVLMNSLLTSHRQVCQAPRSPTPTHLRPRAQSPAGVYCFIPGHIGVDGEAAVQEHDDAHRRGQGQQLSVDPKPGEVEAYLLPKVLPEDKSHILRKH